MRNIFMHQVLHALIALQHECCDMLCANLALTGIPLRWLLKSRSEACAVGIHKTIVCSCKNENCRKGVSESGQNKAGENGKG
jgi:hypothetical protein